MTFYIMDVICLAIFAALAILGWFDGAVSSIIRLIALIASFIIARLLTPHVYGWLIDIDSFRQWLITTVSAWMSANPSALSWFHFGSLGSGISAFFKTIGVGSLGNTAVTASDPMMSIAGKIVQVIIFLILFAVLRILFHVIYRASKAVNKVPVLGTVNRVLGAGVGIIEANIIVLVLVLVVYGVAVLSGNTEILNELSQGMITQYFISVI